LGTLFQVRDIRVCEHSCCGPPEVPTARSYLGRSQVSPTAVSPFISVRTTIALYQIIAQPCGYDLFRSGLVSGFDSVNECTGRVSFSSGQVGILQEPETWQCTGIARAETPFFAQLFCHRMKRKTIDAPCSSQGVAQLDMVAYH